MAAFLWAGKMTLRRSSCVSTLWSRQLSVASAAQQQHAAVARDHPIRAAVKPISEMPGPMRLPMVGSLYSMLLDKDFDRNYIDRYWTKLIEEHGPIVRMDLPGFGNIVLVTNPDDCEILTRMTMDNPVRTPMGSLEKIRKEAIDDYFEQKSGLLTENGDEWKRVRSRVQTPMMKPKNVTNYLTQMDQVSLDFMERIAEYQKELGEMPSSFLMDLNKWALESVSLVALNRRLGCLAPNLQSDSEPMKLIEEAHNMLEGFTTTLIGAQLWRFFPTPAYNKMKKSHNEFLRIADENIRQTESLLMANENIKGEDLTLMETLLLTPGLSRKDVVTLILDMLFAGIDTTSHSVAFTLYLLAKNPECQAKLQKEIDEVLGDDMSPITPKHLAQMSYLKLVIKESQRVFPLVLGTARTLDDDVVLSDYLVPKGFSVMPFGMYMGRQENLFPRAKEFIPERWMRDRPLGPIHPYSHLPFGLGTRMCIGRRIAEQEIYTFLARAMQRYNIDYKYQDMGYFTRSLSVPSEPLRFNFTERR